MSTTEPPGLVATIDNHQRCPATQLYRRLGDKWTPLLIALLAQRSYGFNELDRTIEGISRRVLTRTLRTLEADRLVSRTVHPTKPPRVEYALTDLGLSLNEHLRAFGEWAISAHK